MIKKSLITIVLTVALSLSLAVPASAASAAHPLAVETSDTLLPNAEQTEWVFRITEDGVLQKRLWSITYQEWLTDWIVVPTV